MDSFKGRVMQLQSELKAPKAQHNKFGNYNYRSCEDILEAVKPLLNKYKMILNISDEMKNIGDRYYICATATLSDIESDEKIENIAYAREASEKKGMDDSQITGSTSSYARKYALNGLFCLDDTKDADTNEFSKQTTKSITCEKCGNTIISVKKTDGSMWPIDEMAAYSYRRFGKTLCGSCMKGEMAKSSIGNDEA